MFNINVDPTRYTDIKTLRSLAISLASLTFITGCVIAQGNSQKIVNNQQETVKQLEVEKSPNILFILTDDQAVDTINALGNSAIKHGDMIIVAT